MHDGGLPEQPKNGIPNFKKSETASEVNRPDFISKYRDKYNVYIERHTAGSKYGSNVGCTANIFHFTQSNTNITTFISPELSGITTTISTVY